MRKDETGEEEDVMRDPMVEHFANTIEDMHNKLKQIRETKQRWRCDFF